MGLTQKLQRKANIYWWRLRYWWLDTPNGAAAKVAVFCMAVLVVILQLIRLAVAAVLPPPPGEPVKAVYWWVVQLIIMVVAAAITYAMRPKTEQPKPVAGDAPTVEDGTHVKHHFGTCWVGDEFFQGFKNIWTKPIKTKGGKK